MGQTLSSPSTKKQSESGANGRLTYGIAEMQGWRITMEDSHTAILDLDGTGDGNAFFAVYDGHGGSSVARFAGENVHKRLLTEETYKDKNWEVALKKAFLGTDEDLLANPAHTRDPSGCTAVAALITNDNKIYVANAGDSRSVLSVKGEVKPLSFDHKPTNASERARISGAGGYVEFGRVNGNLALSRALGDFEFKKNYTLSPEEQIITSNPEVTVHELTEEDEFLVIACDGIWDCLTSQQVVDYVRYQVSEGKELTEICEMMCDHCLAPDTISGAGIGCDNMTVLIVGITNGRTQEEWYGWIKDRVKTEYGYKTPSSPPQLYAQSRLLSFRARKEAQEARERIYTDDPHERPITFDREDFLNRHGFALTTFSSYDANDSTTERDEKGFFDPEEDEEDDDLNSSFFTKTFGLRPSSPDPAKDLRQQLSEFELDEGRKSNNGDDHDDLFYVKSEASGPLTESLSSPTKLPNGDVKGQPEPIEVDSEHVSSLSLGEIPEPVKA